MLRPPSVTSRTMSARGFGFGLGLGLVFVEHVFYCNAGWWMGSMGGWRMFLASGTRCGERFDVGRQVEPAFARPWVPDQVRKDAGAGGVGWG